MIHKTMEFINFLDCLDGTLTNIVSECPTLPGCGTLIRREQKSETLCACISVC